MSPPRPGPRRPCAGFAAGLACSTGCVPLPSSCFLHHVGRVERFERRRLRLAAPSARASAKLANSTVNHSQSGDGEDEARGFRPAVALVADQGLRCHSPWSGGCPPRPRTSPGSPAGRACGEKRKARAAGEQRFDRIREGLFFMEYSLRTTSQSAGARPPGRAPAPARRSARRPAARADQQQHEQRACGSATCPPRRDDFLGRQRAGDRQHRDHQPVARDPASPARA
jgi:hypothetical protein